MQQLPPVSDWLSIVIAVIAFAGLLWRMESRLGQLVDMGLKHFEALSKDHEIAMDAASRRHRQVLDNMEAEKDRHRDDHMKIQAQIAKDNKETQMLIREVISELRVVVAALGRDVK